MSRSPITTDPSLPVSDASPTLLDVVLAILFLLSGAGAIFGAGFLLFCSF